MLEEMGAFFARRLEGYEEHQLTTIDGAEEFYPMTARLLPVAPGTRLLDLGCGTGLELRGYFDRCPTARVTGIDLSGEMLEALRRSFPNRELVLIRGSYLELPLGEAVFDAAVSVESLHHFTAEEKLPLFRRVYAALRPGGRFVLTDYYAANGEEEAAFRARLEELRRREGVPEGMLCHYDTPLTAEHETELLHRAGFQRVTSAARWSSTQILVAEKDRE